MPDSQWRLIAALVRPHRRATLAYASALLAATAIPLAASVVLAEFVRRAVRDEPSSRLVPLAAVYAVSGVVAAFLKLAVTWRSTVLAWRITDGLRLQLARFVLHADLAFHRDRTPGELVTRVDGDVTAMTDFLSVVVSSIIAIAALAVGAVLVLAVVEPVLAPALLLGVVLIFATSWVTRDWATDSTVAERTAEAETMSVTEQYLAGADDVAALGAGLHGVGRVAERAASQVAAAGRRVAKQMKVQQSIRMAVVVADVLVIGWGAIGVSRGWTDVAAVVLGFRFVSAIRQPTEQLTWRLQEAQGASGSARRVMDLLAQRQSIADGDGDLPAGPLDVFFNGVTLVYDDASGTETAIDAVTLRIEAGRSVGVLGRSGSGKTSLARLVLRLVTPTGGRVVVGGLDIATVREENLRRRVTAVPQDVQLFPGSVRDNVTMFAERDDDGVRDALRAVGLGTWLDGLPDGISTVLSSDSRDDGGSRVGLSAGQAQLLSIARALMRDPSVVVLDEATSRVDPDTQAAIRAAMARLLAGRTSIVIAHRLDTLDACDDILVLADGRVVEHGTRVDLASDPASEYARLRALGEYAEELA